MVDINEEPIYIDNQNLKRDKLDLRYNSNILAKNMTLSKNDLDFCSGTYIDKDDRIKSCDIVYSSKKNNVFDDRNHNLEESHDDLVNEIPAPEKFVDSVIDFFKDDFGEKAWNTSDEDYQINDLISYKNKKESIGYKCYEKILYDSNYYDYMRYCSSPYCVRKPDPQNNNSFDKDVNNTFNCIKHKDKNSCESDQTVDCIWKLGNTDPDKPSIWSEKKCNKYKSDSVDNFGVKCLKDGRNEILSKSLTENNYKEYFDSTSNTLQDCLINNKYGLWCGRCNAVSSPDLNINVHVLKNIGSRDGSTWSTDPRVGCVYHKGGLDNVFSDLTDIISESTFSSCFLSEYGSGGLIKTGDHNEWIGDGDNFLDRGLDAFVDGAKTAANAVGSAGHLWEDTVKSEVLGLGDIIGLGDEGRKFLNEHNWNTGILDGLDESFEKCLNKSPEKKEKLKQLIEIISNNLTCSDGISNLLTGLSLPVEFIPVYGWIIGAAMNIFGNHAGQCSKETKEIINLHGSCPNGYRNCPGYEIKKNSEGEYTMIETECETDKPEDNCTSCTPIRNMKGIDPGDRGRQMTGSIVGSGTDDKYLTPGIDDWTEDNDISRLDAFNQYFCIDNDSTRVIRPPPQSLLFSQLNQELIDKNGMNEMDYFNAVDEYSPGGNDGLKQTISSGFGLLDDDTGCTVRHYTDIGFSTITEGGDGQGYTQNTCGLPKSDFNSVNPCKDGFTLSGPKYLNPFTNYDVNPCIELNEEKCESNMELGKKIDDYIENDNDKTNLYNQNILGLGGKTKGGFDISQESINICKWDKKNNKCDLQDKIFQSNYCCRDIPGAEECPFSPINSWTKFNFSTIRGDSNKVFNGINTLVFDNNEYNLNTSMIQDLNGCSYKGSLFNEIICNYDSEENEKKDLNKVNFEGRDILQPTHSNDIMNTDNKSKFKRSSNNKLSKDQKSKLFCKYVKTPNEMNEESIINTFSNTIDEMKDGAMEIYSQIEILSGIDDNNTGGEQNSIKREYTIPNSINEYVNSRLNYPDITPGIENTDDSSNDEIEPYYISKLPCLNPENWTVLLNTKNNEKKLIYTHSSSDYDSIDGKYNYKKIDKSLKDYFEYPYLDSSDDSSDDNYYGKLLKEFSNSSDQLNSISLDSAIDLVKNNNPNCGTIDLTKFTNKKYEGDDFFSKNLISQKEMDNNILNNRDCNYIIKNNNFNDTNIYKTFNYISSSPYDDGDDDLDIFTQIIIPTIVYLITLWIPIINIITTIVFICYLCYLIFYKKNTNKVILNPKNNSKNKFGVCDIKTYLSLIDNKNYFRHTEGYDICCDKDNDRCKKVDDNTSKCIKSKGNDKEYIYKTYLNPHSILEYKYLKNIPTYEDKDLSDLCSKNDKYNTKNLIDDSKGRFKVDNNGLLFAEITKDDGEKQPLYCLSISEYDMLTSGTDDEHNYNYQITNKDDCPQEYAYWDGEKCYEKYKKIKPDGEPVETDKNNCEKGYGKWLNNEVCVKLNMNKSDCELSGGYWKDTIPMSQKQPTNNDGAGGDDEDDWIDLLGLDQYFGFNIALIIISIIIILVKKNNELSNGLILMIIYLIIFSITNGLIFFKKINDKEEFIKINDEEFPFSIIPQTYKNSFYSYLILGFILILVYNIIQFFRSDTYKRNFQSFSII